MNRFISVAVTNDNGQPVNKTMVFPAASIISVVDRTSYRELNLWDSVNQNESQYFCSTSLADILNQTSGSVQTLVSVACNATSPSFAGLTVLINPSRIINVSGTSTSIIEYLYPRGGQAVQAITLTSGTNAASTIANLQEAFTVSAGLVRRVKVTIRSADLLGSGITSGVSLLPALGAGFAYNILSVATKASGAGTTVYAGGAVINIQSAGAAQTLFTLPVNILTNASAASKIGKGIHTTVAGAATLDQLVENTAIVAIAASSFTTGNMDLDVFLTYEVVALSL